MSDASNSNGSGTAMVVRQQPQAVAHRGVVITNLDDLARFGKWVCDANMAPKGMSPQGVAVAIQMGLELGMTPMSSLQNIAVINGKPGVFGDAAKALVEASGLMEDFDEYLEVNGKRVDELPKNPPDEARAVCVSKRVGRRMAKTTIFTVGQAKRAGLWGKTGYNGQPSPWITYPERMLLFRARGFNLRDNFPDVLKGFRTAEELRDYPDHGEPASMQTANTPKQVEAVVTSATPATTTPPPVQVEAVEPAKERSGRKASAAQRQKVEILCARKGIDVAGLIADMDFNSLEEMTPTDVTNLIDRLNEQPDATVTVDGEVVEAKG